MDPGGFRLSGYRGCDRDDRGDDQGDQEGIEDAGVNDERGADEGSPEHGGYGDQATPRLGSLAACDAAVGGEAGDGQGEHGGGQVGYRELAGGGVLDAHREGEDDDQRVTVRGGDRVTAERRQDDRGGEERCLHAGGGAE